MIRNPRFALLTVCTLALSLAQHQAQAQVVPFEIIGAGIAPDGIPLPGAGGLPHWAVGYGTGLGKYYGEGQVETDTANFLPDGHITGEFGSAVPFLFTAENGDVLACYYGRTDFGAKEPGTFDLTPVPELGEGVYVAFWIAEFVPFDEECTGKFAGIGGSWIMYAWSEPFVLGADDPVAYAWTGEGSLTFKKGH